MDINRAFLQYSSDLLHKATDAEYFAVVNYRNEYRGAYKFVKMLCANNWSVLSELQSTYNDYLSTLDNLITEKSQF